MTWSPLRHWKVGEVTLFTRSAGKEDDAHRLGARHVVLSGDDALMKSARGRLDLIVDIVLYVHDVNRTSRLSG